MVDFSQMTDVLSPPPAQPTQSATAIPASPEQTPAHVEWHRGPGGAWTDLSDADYVRMSGLPSGSGLPATPIANPIPPVPGQPSFGSPLLDQLFGAPSSTPPAFSITPNQEPPLSPIISQRMAEVGMPREQAVQPDPRFPVKPGETSGYIPNMGRGFLQGVAGIGDVNQAPLLGVINPILEHLGYPRIPSNSELAGMLMDHIMPIVPGTQGERLVRAAARGVGGMVGPAGVARTALAGAKAGAEPLLRSLVAAAGPGGIAAGAAGGATGEIASELVPDRFKPLAELLGNLFGAGAVAIPTAAATAAGRAAKSAISTAANPSAQIPRLVGEAVLKDTGGTPNFVKAPGVFGDVPLTVAQATPGGSPELSASIDAMQTKNKPLLQRTRSAQNAEIHDVLSTNIPPSSAMAPGMLDEPLVAGGRASARATRAAQGAYEISGKEERRLWNTPAMSEPKITAAAVKAPVLDEIATIRGDQPGLGLAIDESSALRRAITDFEAMPDKVAAKDINAISSRFRAIQRDPLAPGDERIVAGRLANATQKAIWDAPEVSGRGPVYRDAFDRFTWDKVNPGKLTPKVLVYPKIDPDPVLVRDLTAARAFTQREAQVFGHASFDNIIKRNSKGNATVVPETALEKFYDFAHGTGRPGEIKDVLGFMRDIASEWRKLGIARAGGEYDPVQLANVSQELATGTRDFFLAKMYRAMNTNERDLTGKPMIDANKAITFLKNERDLMLRSGAMSKDEMTILDSFKRTLEMIKSESDLQRTRGSATASRLLAPSHLSDIFLPPLARKMVGPASALGGVILTRMFGEGAIGGMILAEMAGVGTASAVGGHMAGNAILNRLYAVPHERLLEALREAYHDPAIAHDLAMKVGKDVKPFRPSAATVGWLRTLLATQPGTLDINRKVSAAQIPVIEPTLGPIRVRPSNQLLREDAENYRQQHLE